MGFDDSVHGGIERRDFLALSAGLITAMSLGGTVGHGGQPRHGRQIPRRKMRRQNEKESIGYLRQQSTAPLGESPMPLERNCAARTWLPTWS